MITVVCNGIMKKNNSQISPIHPSVRAWDKFGRFPLKLNWANKLEQSVYHSRNSWVVWSSSAPLNYKRTMTISTKSLWAPHYKMLTVISSPQILKEKNVFECVMKPRYNTLSEVSYISTLYPSQNKTSSRPSDRPPIDPQVHNYMYVEYSITNICKNL